MANVKITGLTAITAPANTDVLPIVDVSADVTKKVSIADLLESAGDGTAALPAFAFDSDKDIGMYRVGANQLGFATAGTSRIVVDASGNVGIGDSNPDFNLVVKSSANTNANIFAVKDSDGIKMVSVEQDSNGNGRLFVRGTSGNAAVLLHTNGNSYFNGGNVGIGTPTPLASSGFAGVTASGSTGGIYWFAKAGAQKGYLYGADNDVTLASTDASGVIRFLSGGNSERMQIDSSGNVGIGTSAPAISLDVHGADTSANGLGDVKGQLRVFNDTTAFGSSPRAGIVFSTKYRTSPDVPIDGAAIYGGKENATDANKDFFLAFATRDESPNEAVERMRIDSSGNVGIGTTSPDGLLHIASATGLASNVISTTAGSDAEIEFRNTNGGNATWAAGLDFSNSKSFNLSYASAQGASLSTSPAVTVTTGGNVGVGTSSPSQKLHLLGSNAALQIQDSNATNSIGRIINAGGSLFIQSQNNTSHGTIIFRTSNGSSASERMRIDSSGRALIGTTSASGDSLLQVNGPIKVQGGAIFASHSRAYTASTTAAGLFGIQMNGGHGFADLTWAFVDTGYPNGVRMGKIFLTFRGSGTNITAVSIVPSTECSITSGTVASITWTASVGNVSNVRLNATASAASGNGTMYLYGTSPFFSGLNPIANA